MGIAGQGSEPGDKAGWIFRGGHRELLAALGAGKCRMYLIPLLNMIALRQGDSKVDRFNDNTFLSLLLTGKGTAAKASLGHTSTSTTNIYLLDKVQESMKVVNQLAAKK